MTSRDDVVAKAREFEGTPYAHLGRLKKRAIDCLGLVLLTCQELGLHDALGAPIRGDDYHDYPEFPEDGFIHREFVRRAIFKPVADVQPGDFVTIRFIGVPSHCGIISQMPDGNLGLIHCYRTVGKVAEHRFADKWRSKVNGTFTLPGIR